jgi:putative tryptophan/tyrosine transport system substrate-binding protein
MREAMFAFAIIKADIRAQQTAMPVIGFLHQNSALDFESNVLALLQGLTEYGYAEGRNVRNAFRRADGASEGLPEMAADLVQRQVGVIVHPGRSSGHACGCCY